MASSVKRLVVIFFAALFAGLLTGCLGAITDELYAIPKGAKEYEKLQERINEVLDAGAVYAPPIIGVNRQSVQLRDLDGDGVSEAIVFFLTKEDKPLKIYVFSKTEDDYEVSIIIEGIGTAIDSIRYIDMNGDGWAEIVVGWQMSPSLKQLSICSIKDYHLFQLAASDYKAFSVVDINGDGYDDVLAVRLDAAGTAGEVTYFSLMTDGEIVSGYAALSQGVEQISRVLSGRLTSGAQALFVESAYEQTGVITDVFSWRNNHLENITLRSDTGASSDTMRMMRYYSSDVNKDGIIDIPIPRPLPAQSETTYYAIEWYNVTLGGRAEISFVSYHNYSDSWYLVLPMTWQKDVTVRRDDTVAGERHVVFSYCSGDGEVIDFLKIYTLSGDNKEDRAAMENRFVLLENANTIYAAEFLKSSGLVLPGLNEELITRNFHIIYSDWITGVI